MPLIPQQNSIDTHLHQRLPSTHRQVRLSLLWSLCSFLLDPGVHKVLFVFSKGVCLPVLWNCCSQILLTFQVRFPWDTQSLCQIPRLGSLLWGLELSQQCKNLFGITVLQFVDHLPGGSMAGLMTTSSKRSYARTPHLPGLLLSVSLSPQQATADPCFCRRPSNTHRQVWFNLSWGSPLLSRDPGVHKVLFLPPRVSGRYEG